MYICIINFSYLYTNRAINLLKTLYRNEQDELLDYLRKQNKTKSHQTCKVLVKLLDKKNGNFTKEDIFYGIYKYEYAAKFDYLLRNDFRILSREIEDFIGSNNVFPMVGQLRMLTYLSVLLRTGDTAFFEKEYQAKDAQITNPYLREWLERIYYDFSFKNLQLKEKYLLDYKQKLKEHRDNVLKNATVKLAELSAKQAFVNKQLELLGVSGYEEEPSFFGIDLEDPANAPTIQYLVLKSATYKKSGDEAIKALQQCSSMLDSDPHPYLVREFETIWVLSNLGFHYYLSGDFAKAATCFESAYSQPLIGQYQLRGNILFNLVSSLLKSPDFHKADEIMERYRKDWESENRLRCRFLFQRVLIHMALKRNKEAKQLLVTMSVPESSYDYYYFRTLLVLIFILNDEYERAVMELRNYKQIRFAMEELGQFHKMLCYVFKYYLKLYDKAVSLGVWDDMAEKGMQDALARKMPPANNVQYHDSIMLDFLDARVEQLRRMVGAQ